MSNKILLAIELLKISVSNKNPNETLQIINNICEYFDDGLTPAETDLSVDKVFSDSDGLLRFLKQTIKENKLFKNSNIKVIQLFQKLIVQYHFKIKEYADTVLKVMITYILSVAVTAIEKENAVLVVQEIVSHKLVDHNKVPGLLNDLLQIINPRKNPGRFLQNLYVLVGMICRDYPECVLDNEQSVRNMYMDPLEKCVLQLEQIPMPILTGAMTGLNYCLINFAPSPSSEAALCSRIYKCAKKLSNFMEDIHNQTLFRASLKLLSEHSSIVSLYLYQDCVYWHTELQKWLNAPSFENRCAGIYAVHALHREIAVQIAETNEPTPANINHLKFFINHFHKILLSQTSKSYEIRIAIRGFGHMAGLCKTFLPLENILELLTLVMQRTEYVALERTGSNKKDGLEHYPDFVQALSKIMEHITELSGIQITSLELIIITLIRDFHYLSSAHHALATNSLLMTFSNLARLGGSILDDVLHKVILQGVIWTSSHKLILDSNNEWDTLRDWKEHITYKSYLPLWIGLMGYSANGSESLIIKKIIFKHFMTSFFTILNKLNFATNKRVFKDADGNDQEFYFCDPNCDLVPVKPKDFHIFFNLVGFYKDILQSTELADAMTWFRGYINQFCQIAMQKFFKYPLVSGFLKLMKIALTIGVRLNYFTDDNPMSDQIAFFIKHIIAKAQQTFGELQLSCLQMIFTAPVLYLRRCLLDLIPMFQIAFAIGKSVLSIAVSALTLLEKLCKTMTESPHDMDIFLRDVLPLLDPYLKSSGVMDDTDIGFDVVRYKSSRKSKKVLRPTTTDSELLKFQKRIVLFLGTLEPKYCLYLVSTDLKQQNLTKLDAEQAIKLTLYYGDMKPNIYLDTLIPRVCQIAIMSSDRKTKIAACELVHAIVLYLLGTNNSKGPIWQKLCEHMLLLGCDGDVAVQQMFEPLLIQIMHFLSHRNHLLNPGVEVLFDCLMEGISHRTNSALRDLAARCLREFLAWTIKQTTPEQMRVSPMSIVMILSKLKLYSFDSESTKRHGAALAFNNLYRIIREEESIVVQFWLDFLYTFSISFIMSEELTTETLDANSFDQIETSLDHVARVLREKKQLFNDQNDLRIAPEAFNGNTLYHAVLWLFKQCGAKQQFYRKMAIKLFNTLAPAVDNFNSVRLFVTTTQTVDSILDICEGSDTGIRLRPNLNHIKDGEQTPVNAIFNWLEHLLSTLDCYNWLISDGLTIDAQSLLKKSVILKVVPYYLNTISTASVLEILMSIDPILFDDSADSLDFTTEIQTIDRIDNIKCTITMRILEFLVNILPTCHMTIPSSFWQQCSPCLGDLLIKLIFEPHLMGFELKYQEINRLLPQRIEKLIMVLQTLSPSTFVMELNTKIGTELITKFKVITEHIQESISSDSIPHGRMQHVLGIELICSKLKKFAFTKNLLDDLDAIGDQVLNNLFEGLRGKRLQEYYPIYPTPDAKIFAHDLLAIYFYLPENSVVKLLQCMLNDLELRQINANCSLTHGEHFLNVYKLKIFDYLLKTPESAINQIGNRLNVENVTFISRCFIQLTQYVYKYRLNDKPCVETIVRALLQIWPRLLEWTNKQEHSRGIVEYVLIELMSHIALICPFKLCNIRSLALSFENWLLEVISYRHNSIELKSRAVFLLPCLLDNTVLVDEVVVAALEKLQLQYFPLKTGKLIVGSLERMAYMNVFKTLLDAMVASKSIVLLRFIIYATAADPKHIMEYAIRESLSKFMEHQNGHAQVNAFKVPFELFLDETKDPTVRMLVIRRYLLIMLKCSSVSAVIHFYTEHMDTIVILLTKEYGFDRSGWDINHKMICRLVGYQLIEALFGALTKEQILDVQNGLSVVQGKSITSFLMDKANKTRSETFTTENAETKELFRLYQCAAYRAMITMVSCTQTDLRYYSSFLFKENPTKNEFIWQKIINCTDEQLYTNCSQEFDDTPKIKERIVSIRNSNSTSLPATTSAKYLQSQNVFDSSLSQDVTKIDLTCSAIRTDAEVAAMEPTQQNMIIKLEKMPINDHEVMASMCAVIQHMFDNKITPCAEEEPIIVSRRAPTWAEFIANHIGNTRLQRNIRYFLVKVVENCRHLFRQYAITMTRPVLQFLIDEISEIGQLNFFLTDLVVMLLEWGDLYKIQSVEEINLGSSLLRHLMANAWHERKDIFKQNLEIIKMLVEQWRDVVILPKQWLLDSISHTNWDLSRENIGGLQINAIVLANNLLPWTDSSVYNFMRSLFTCLKQDKLQVYGPAAHIIGMAFTHILPANEYTEHDLFKHLWNELDLLRANKKDKKFTDILYGVQKSFPQIIDSFLVTISSLLSTTSGAVKRIYMEMYLCRMDVYGDEIYREMMSIGCKTLLQNGDSQLYALHMINKALPKMSIAQVNSLLAEVRPLIDSKKSDCRDVCYELFMYIRDNVKDQDIQQEVTTLLLNGLDDSDAEIQSRLLKFWSDAARLSPKIDQRILEIFGKLYDPNSEKHFLNYCTQLLLEPAILSADSKRPVFLHNSDNEFKLKEYDINISWKTQNSTLRAPLFMESQQKQAFADDMSPTQNYLRATVNSLVFEPTQDPQMMSQTSNNFTLQTQSSLLFSVEPQKLNRRSQRVSTTSENGQSAVDKSFYLLRKRFLRDKEKTNRLQALAAIDRHSFKAAVQSHAQPKKERQVTLYRRYRHGEYPDLLINSLALLLPLNGLIKRDKLLARQVLIAIFNAVIEELGFNSKQFIISLSAFIEEIFNKSKNAEPMVFAAALEIALTNPKYFNLPPEIVSSFCCSNNMQAIGILYLESRLHCNWDTDELRSAKTTTSTVDAEQKHWLKLSEMYRSLAENDIVAGIFSDKLNVDEKIPKAIELELNGDYLGAQKIYFDVISRGKLLEQDFAYQSYYQVFECLSDWTSLAKVCQNQYNDVEDLWTDEFNLENLLPRLIKAHLRQVLAGDGRSRDFLLILESWIRVPEKADYIKIHFGEEMMMFHMANLDYRMARYYGEQCLTGFLSDWRNLTSLSSKVRMNKLLGMRTVAEIYRYAEMMLTQNYSGYTVPDLATRWENSSPQITDSTVQWESIIAYRIYVRSLLSNAGVADDVCHRLQEALYCSQFKLMNIALEQKNVHLAHHIIKYFVTSMAKDSTDLNNMKLAIARYKHQSLRSINRATTTSINCYLKAWQGIDEKILQNDLIGEYPEICIEALNEVSHLTEEIFLLLPKIDAEEALTLKPTIMRLIDCHEEVKIDESLYQHSVKALRECISKFNESTNQSIQLGDAYYKLSDLVHVLYENERIKHLDIVEREKIIIESLLRAMQYNSTDARQVFPQLLQLPQLQVNTQLQDTFKNESLNVPEWMFLGWIPQILSILTFDRDHYLDDLVLRIATTYPMAIFYAFQQSFNQYHEQNSSTFDRSAIVKICDSIKNPMAEKFMQAILCVCIPDKMLYLHLNNLLQMLQRPLSNIEFVKHVKNIVRMVYGNDGGLQGSAFEKIQKYKNIIMNLQTYNVKTELATIVGIIQKINTVLTVALMQSASTINELKALCPWLDQFQWCGEEQSIEIPGQYNDSTRRPNHQSHIRLVKLQGTITVYTTLRLPIKIIMHGSNGRSYEFLIKYGEDLRQDQRVQQLLKLMSDQLMADKNCRNLNMNIRTYNVIPINSYCGILSWVTGTQSMKDMVLKALNRRESDGKKKLDLLREDYNNFIEKPSKGITKDLGHLHNYGRAAANYSRENIINNLRAIENKLPEDLLKVALMNLCASPESFFAFRNNFAISLAVMNISNWLLGVGDRHLSNILINVKDGSVVGIDFGMCFGAATRNIPIPELMPFRLSSHLVKAIDPLGVTGFITKTMIHALRCFRKNHKLLMACMKVFVNEPTMDWLESARNYNYADNTTNDHTINEWHPSARIQIADRKLMGANPMQILSEELRLSKIASHPEFLNGYQKLLHGHEQHNIRARLPADNLSVEEQIKCLLDMATDSAILGIAWRGYEPWI